MTTVNNGVTVITGAAHGQGGSHAEAPARGGYDIIAVDRCADIATIPYPLATREDLDETAGLVKSFGRRVVTALADVRSLSDLQAAITTGVDQLGDIDVVVANAGVVAPSPPRFPSMIRKGSGGSIILVSSKQGLDWRDAGATVVPPPSPMQPPSTGSSG